MVTCFPFQAEESAELNDFDNEDLSPGQNAARRRIVQEHINQRVLASSQQSKKVPEKKVSLAWCC